MAEIEKKRSYQRALMGLRHRILVGELMQGDRVSEVALAEELGISRTPLREAMRELVDQGLLERVPTGGCRVCSLTKRDVMDAIELRGLLEGAVFRIAAERGITAAQHRSCAATIAEIDGVLDDQSAHVDFERYVELNEQLHAQLAVLSDSQVMQAELARVCRRPMAGPSAFLQGQSLAPQTLRSLCVAQDQHKAILDAIVNREGARAEALAREHARLAHRNLDFFLGAESHVIEQIPGLTLVQQDCAALNETAE